LLDQNSGINSKSETTHTSAFPKILFSCKICNTHHSFGCIKDQKMMEEELMESEYLSPARFRV
jgi:hypothetical protein